VKILKLTQAEVNHLLGLVEESERSGIYTAPIEHYKKRTQSLKRKLENAPDAPKRAKAAGELLSGLSPGDELSQGIWGEPGDMQSGLSQGVRMADEPVRTPARLRARPRSRQEL